MASSKVSGTNSDDFVQKNHEQNMTGGRAAVSPASFPMSLCGVLVFANVENTGRAAFACFQVMYGSVGRGVGAGGGVKSVWS